MFFIISKLVYWLIIPIGQVTTLGFVSLFIRHKQVKIWLRMTALFLAVFYSNPFIANWAMSSWEPTPVLYAEIQHTYDYGIVLGGITDAGKKPTDRAHFLKGADRIVHALDLYRQGKIKKILISGGSGKVLDQTAIESEELKAFLLNAKVRKRDILIEPDSRNTYENAKFSTELIQKSKAGSSCLLITSAFHMSRAKRCFNKQGLQVATFPTDYYGTETSYTPVDLFLPSIDAIYFWSKLIKEWFGLLSYWMMGYI